MTKPTLYFLSLLLLMVPGVALAGGALPPLVDDIGYALMLSGILAVVFNRLNIPSIAAFLVAGVVAGPIGMELVTKPQNIDVIAQLGLVFLLFLIGLEIDFRKIMASGKTLIIAGLLQFPLCTVFGFIVAKFFLWIGFSTELLGGDSGTGFAPLYIGFAMAASSTLLVVKLFQESFQLDTTAGRISLGMLVFQDIWAIIVIAIQPNIADPQIVPILISFLGIGILAGLSVLISKTILPFAFAWVAKVPELILVAAIGWCFSIVFIGASLDTYTLKLFGMETHLAVGAGMSALIAGATLASLPYAKDVLGKVSIVKDFFVVLFFVGLGMSIPMPDSMSVLTLSVVLAILAIFVRYLIFFPLLYFTGMERQNSFVISTRLAQVSEFVLVIAYAGMQYDHITTELNAVLIFTFVITALLTPFLFKYTDTLYPYVRPWLTKLGITSPDNVQHEKQESYDLALLGFHRIASSILHDIQQNKPDMLKKMLIVDFNTHLHESIASLGPTVCYGDLANEESLQHAGLSKANIIVVTVQDDLLKGTSNEQIVEAVKTINPNAVVIANAIEFKDIEKLYEAGADYVFMPRLDVSLSVGKVIDAVMEGKLADYRDQECKERGHCQERKEILN